MAGFDALVVSRLRHDDRGFRAGIVKRGGQNMAAFAFGVFKMAQERVRIGDVKIPARIGGFGLLENRAVCDFFRAFFAVKIEFVYVIDILHIHGETLQAVCQFAGNGRAFETANLLKIGELAHFHSIAPDFPAQPPCAESRAFPIVFDKTDVIERGINADGAQ